MTPDEDVEDDPLIRPCESRQVVFVPLVLEVPVILPWASRKVVLPLLDCVAVPVILPWVSLKVVLVPEVLAVVADLPFSSLRLAFLPARDEAGSATASMGNRRARISFMRSFDDVMKERFTFFKLGLHPSIRMLQIPWRGWGRPFIKSPKYQNAAPQ